MKLYTPLCQTVDQFVSRLVGWLLSWSPFWAVAPKDRCPAEHRGQCPDVLLSVCPSVHLSFHPSIHLSVRPSVPPIDHQGFKLALPYLKYALQTSNMPSRRQICPPDCESHLQASNQPSVPQIFLPNLKSRSKPQLCPQAFKYAFKRPKSVI